jgi:hypothetical protein
MQPTLEVRLKRRATQMFSGLASGNIDEKGFALTQNLTRAYR